MNMERVNEEEFFVRFSRYLKEEPVFEGEYFAIEIRNDYGVTSRMHCGGEYVALVYNIWQEGNWAYAPSVFMPFNFFLLYGYSGDIVELIAELKIATPYEIDELAREVKEHVELALEGGYDFA